jgi:hypothetical protein
MAIDTACWLIFACAIALIGCGCIYTRAERHPVSRGAGEVRGAGGAYDVAA